MNSRTNSDSPIPRTSFGNADLPLPENLPNDRLAAALIYRVDRIRREQSRKLELRTADLRILWLFADNQPRTLKEIAGELRLEQSTVNRQINAAMAEGLLRRSRRSGGSIHEISRTDKGERVFEDDVAKALTDFTFGLDALGDRADEFLADLACFVDAYENAVKLDSQ